MSLGVCLFMSPPSAASKVSTFLSPQTGVMWRTNKSCGMPWPIGRPVGEVGFWLPDKRRGEFPASSSASGDKIALDLKRAMVAAIMFLEVSLCFRRTKGPERECRPPNCQHQVRVRATRNSSDDRAACAHSSGTLFWKIMRPPPLLVSARVETTFSEPC